jgi:hypothetical protein
MTDAEFAAAAKAVDSIRWSQARSWWRVWKTMQLLSAVPDPRAELRRMVHDVTHPDVERGQVCPLLVNLVENLARQKEMARGTPPAAPQAHTH